MRSAASCCQPRQRSPLSPAPRIIDDPINGRVSAVSASEGPRPPEVVLDGGTLTPAAVALIAREDARVALAAPARERNEAAARVAERLVRAGPPLYGASTGVGALSGRPLRGDEHAEHSLRLLRSHAAGAGAALRRELVRAAMA